MIPQTIYAGSEHQAFRDTVRRFIDREIAPYHDQWEKDGIVSRALWTRAGAAGLLCPAIPAEYGGGGGDFTYGVPRVYGGSNEIMREFIARSL